MLKRIKCILMTAVIIISAAAMGVTSYAKFPEAVFVAPDGSDKNDGSFGSPLASLGAAKERAKKISGDVIVYFRQGEYTLTDTVNFNSSDKKGVTYRAYSGERVVFTAGTPYTGFEECTVNGVKAVKKYVGTGADFNVLFNSETTLPRTRYPESGYLYIKNVDEKYCINPELEEYADFHKGYTALIADKKDIPVMKNENDAVVRVLHFWKDEMLNIKKYHSDTDLMEFTKPSSMTLHKNERYFIENVFEALDKPGEWYLDKAEGMLYYIPQAGESAEDLTLWGSVTETLINIDGADGIKFENIIFRGNGFNIPKNRDFSQAAYDAPSCIMCSNSSGLLIKNCEFRDIAACAVFMGVNVQNAQVDSCVFSNIGAQAVYIRGENYEIENPKVTKNISVTNNLINGYGRVFFNAVGILIIHANTVTACNNEICDGYYTAISVGWSWGFGHNITYNNNISDNLIYNIGQGWLSDMGGIYTLGIQPGTVLSGNVIHNVAADPGEGGYGGWGIYLDEGSSEMLVEKNLVYACGSDGYHLHYGHNNIVRNNIFAMNAESQVRVVSALSRVEGSKNTADFINNILLTDGRALTFSYLDSKEGYTESGNVLWDLTYGDDLYLSLKDSSKKVMSYTRAAHKGYIENSCVFDPMFKDAANFDFELREDSPVFDTGFEKFDYSSAGTKQGSTIGVSAEGGATPYNANSAAQNYVKAREKFHFFIKLWYKIADFFSGLFR